MKPSVIVGIIFALVATSFSINAQVTNFSLFKVTVYHQTSGIAPASPDTPDAYYFGAQVNFVDSSNYVDVTVTGPGDAPTGTLSEITPYYFNFGSAYYPDKTDFDADYPSGEYDFTVDYTNSADMGSVVVPDQELYATNIAAFTPTCWNAMQMVDPAVDFILDWNYFVPLPGVTAAYTFVDIFNETTGESPFSADFMTPDTMTTNIPAGTLKYGETYRVNTFFSSRQDTLNAGFGGAFGTVGFDNLTYAELKTIAPWLKISAANANVVLTWPTLASNFVLQGVSQLPGTGFWTSVTNAPVAMDGTNSLTLPATGFSRFFRLSTF